MTSQPHQDAGGWRESVELALKHADIATRLVQFFVLASVALGGWVVASEELRQAPPFSNHRLVWAALYTLLSAPIWLALLDLQARINACYAHARKTLPVDAQGLARAFETKLVAIGFPAFVVAVDLIIVLMRSEMP